MVDFLVIGAQKAGTTSIYHYFKNHSQIIMSPTKEIHFFNNVTSVNSSQIKIYHKNFTFIPGKLTGEITPAYLFCKHCPQHIYEYKKDIKLIAILRNPIERAYAHYCMKYPNESSNFNLAILKDIIRYYSGKKYGNISDAYFRRGLYYMQLKKYYKIFNPQQIKVIIYSDYKKNPLLTLNEIYRFLGIAEIEELKKDAYKTTTYKHPMPKIIKYFLKVIYKSDILKLEKLINRNLSSWYT